MLTHHNIEFTQALLTVSEDNGPNVRESSAAAHSDSPLKICQAVAPGVSCSQADNFDCAFS